MKDKSLLMFIGSGLVALMLVAILFRGVCMPEEKAPGKLIELVFATYKNPGDAMYDNVKRALDYIEEKAEGRVKFTYYPGKTLVSSKEAYPGVIEGVCDITIINASAYPGRFPLSEVMNLYPSLPSQGFLDDANWDFFEQFLEKEDWAKVKPLYIIPSTGDALFVHNKQVRRPRDLKGLQIFSAGMSQKNMVAWGAAPVFFHPGEVYDALRKGTIDGAKIGFRAGKSIRLGEICKYTIVGDFSGNLLLVVMRLEKYNALPSDIKELFDKLHEWAPDEYIKVLEQQNQKTIEFTKEQGNEVIILSPEERVPFFKTAMGVNDEWAEKREAKGLPGEKILEQWYKVLKQYKPQLFE